MRRKSLALPLRVVDYSNSSQIVSLLTREAGLVEGIAKGAHCPRNPFQGPFDLAVAYEVVFLPRRTGGLAIVAEAEVREGFRGLREVFERFLAANMVIEFLRAVATSEPSPELFDLAVVTLASLDDGAREDLGAHLLGFEVRALQVLGFLASVDACVVCGRSWPGKSRPAFFSPRRGGLVCRRCREAAGFSHDPARVSQERADLAGRQLSGAAVELLNALARKPEVGDREACGSPGEIAARLDRRGLRPLHQVVLETSIILLERSFKMLEYSPRWIR